MGISRTIVEAVRAREPPGRFLEKDQQACLWFDIGDKKAIEKTSQALRDSAASLRKQLSEDLADPDFLQAVFDEKTAKELSDADKPKKPTKPSKGHRRTRSDPMGGKMNKSSAKRPSSSGSKGKKVDSRRSISSIASVASSAQKPQKRSSSAVAKKTHKRIHSADSAPTNTCYSRESAPGSPYPHARRSSPASPGSFLRMSPPVSPYSHTWASPPTSPYPYNYQFPSSPYQFNSYYQQPQLSPGPQIPQHGFQPVDAQKSSSNGNGSAPAQSGGNAPSSQSPAQYPLRPQHSGFAPSSPTPYMPYPASTHQATNHTHSPYYHHQYPPQEGRSPGGAASVPPQGAHSEQRPSSLVIPELGQDNEKQSRSSGSWLPKPQTSESAFGFSDAPPNSRSASHALGPRPHHYPYYQHGHHQYPNASAPPPHWPQPPPSPRQKTASPESSSEHQHQQQSNWPNPPPPPPSRQKDNSPPAPGFQQQSRPPPSPRPGASSPSPCRSQPTLHTSRPPPSPRQRPCSPGPGQHPPPRPPPSPGSGSGGGHQRTSSPGPGPLSMSMPPPRPPASPSYGNVSPQDGGPHKSHLHKSLPPQGGGGRISIRTSPLPGASFSRHSSDIAFNDPSGESRDEDGVADPLADQCKPRKSFTFEGGRLHERTERSRQKDEEGNGRSFHHMENSTSAQHVTPSPSGKQHVSYRCSPEAVEAVESFELSPVADIDQMDEDYQPYSPEPRDPRKGGGSNPAMFSMEDDLEVSPLPYRSNPLQDLGASPLRELNENLLLLSPSSLSPPRGINMTPSSEDF